MKIKIQSSCQGIALIIVMLVILVLAALAGAFAYSMKVETTLARNADFESEMEWMGRSGVDYARWVLAQQLKCPNQPFEALNQAWAGGPGGDCSSNGPLAGIERTIPLGNGSITWKITDQERKFNINMADQAVLLQAMTIMGVDASLTPTISDSILDWIDKEEVDAKLSGAENEYYLSLDPPYLAKNGPLDDVSELLLIKGISENPEIYWGSASTNHSASPFQERSSGRPFPDRNKPSYPVGLVDIFTTLSSGKINVNTASITTLQMIPGINENAAFGIIQRRSGLDGVDGTEDDEPLPNVTALRAIPGLENTQDLSRYCDVRSLTFDVEVNVELGGLTRVYYAVLRRGTRAGDYVTMKFYWK